VKLFMVRQQLHASLRKAQRTNALAANRRILEVARRYTTEEVQELRSNLRAGKKELEVQRLAHPRQQHTSAQVEEEQQSQLTALEKSRDDAIDSLADLRKDLNKSAQDPV